MYAWQYGLVIWLKLGAEGAGAVTADVGATACDIMLWLKLVHWEELQCAMSWGCSDRR